MHSWPFDFGAGGHGRVWVGEGQAGTGPLVREEGPGVMWGRSRQERTWDSRIWELGPGLREGGAWGEGACRISPRAEQEELLGLVGLLSCLSQWSPSCLSPAQCSLPCGPRWARMLAEVGFPSGKGFRGWGWSCVMPEVICSALGLCVCMCQGTTCFPSDPKVVGSLRNNHGGINNSC